MSPLSIFPHIVGIYNVVFMLYNYNIYSFKYSSFRRLYKTYQ